MKTTKIGTTFFHHNNYKGDVEIVVPSYDVSHVENTQYVDEHYVFKIPFEHMKTLVLQYYRDKLVEIAESNAEDFERWLMRQK